MNYQSIADTAASWGITERVVRQYCEDGRVPGAFIKNNSWLIPVTAEKPPRKKRENQQSCTLLYRLKQERDSGISGGIYHYSQVEFAYNSNHIEGSTLTHDQTRYIFETNTISPEMETKVDDLIETVNHFRCFDMILDAANRPLSETLIKQLHAILKAGTEDSRKAWFSVGGYKKLPNEVGGQTTTPPDSVSATMKQLLSEYRQNQHKDFDSLLDFHYQFESIHPFQDGNGRVGRLILFKECLHYGIIPFIITDDLKYFYYRGLREWPREPGYLRDTCLSAQDLFTAAMNKFGLPTSE